jgi:hypothetical protein
MSSTPTFDSGGLIYSTAALTATDCVFDDSSAYKGGMIYQSGPMLTLTRCRFETGGGIQGGGIYASGTVSLQYCDFNFLHANGSVNGAAGTGVYLSSGSLTLDSCSFYNVGVTDLQHAFYGNGGAVYCNGSFFAKNCTFAGCDSLNGGALFLTSGGTLWNCTVAQNQAGTAGGIYGSVTLESTIVSNNTAYTAPDVLGAVTAKNCALGTASGFTSYTDQGGNLAFGLNLQMASDAEYHGGIRYIETVPILATSPCKDKGSNPSNALYESRGPGLARTVGAAPDIGAFEIQPPPQVSLQLNDGSIQRSRVTQFVITFNHLDITTTSGIKNACQLKRVSDNAVVTIALGGTGSGSTPTSLSYAFHFTAGPLNNGALADGVYELIVFGMQIADETGQHLDGNGDGIGGDDYVSPTMKGDPNRIFRLFGDADGSGQIDLRDFAQFRGAFSHNYNSIFDFDGSGTVDMQDFTQFQSRYGMMV